LVNDIHNRPVKSDGEQTTVQALHNHATSLLDVLRNIDSTGTYRPAIDGEVIEIIPVDGRDLPLEHRLAVYDNIVRTAWSDGVVTKDEQAMLDDMAMYLGLEPYDTEPIEKRVREESIDPEAENSSLYQQMLEVAWQDGEVDANEQAMLDSLAGMLGLASARDVQLDWVCDRLDDRMKAYCSAMEASWGDGRVSDDEENILQNLRNSLSISEQEHKTILGVVRAKLN
jgi:tellurite resistance protein